jgi:predicted enzyme related to lactoylglutathione lyase
MADVDSVAPGSFCWPELATTDRKGGVAFYRDLFGWDVTDQSIGPEDIYSMFKLRGREVAAAYTMRADERQMGIPPHWNTYVSVKNADDAAKRAQQLGGKVIAPAFDVMDAGRMAVLQDPTGAIFQVWQANKHVGTRVQGEAGALCWTELATRDTKAAETFYTQLFGWSAKTGNADSAMPYTEFSLGGRAIGGMMPMPAMVPAQVPAYWMPYFQVSDVNAAVAKGTKSSASIVVPATDMPKVGRFAVITDPQGALFAVFTPAS